MTTAATGTANIKVAADGAVSGSDNTCVVTAGARLTPAQLAAYNMGSLYVNVHSNANKVGEICAQLKP